MDVRVWRCARVHGCVCGQMLEWPWACGGGSGRAPLWLWCVTLLHRGSTAPSAATGLAAGRTFVCLRPDVYTGVLFFFGGGGGRVWSRYCWDACVHSPLHRPCAPVLVVRTLCPAAVPWGAQLIDFGCSRKIPGVGMTAVLSPAARLGLQVRACCAPLLAVCCVLCACVHVSYTYPTCRAPLHVVCCVLAVCLLCRVCCLLAICVRHVAVRCCAVLCGAVRCCAVLCGAVRCCAGLCGAVRGCAGLCGAVCL